jgi:signal transduction histidine kinase
MSSNLLLPGLSRKKLRRWLLLFFLALAIPTAVLIQRAYSELKWESFHQYRLQAEELAARIDGHVVGLVNDEEARSFADYVFLNVAGDTEVNFVQRSPLSAFPVGAAIPGLVGYFQVDSQGVFSTPLLPRNADSAATYGISRDELRQRTLLADRMQKILSQNQLLRDEEAAPGKARRDGGARQREKQQSDDFAAAAAPVDKDVQERKLADGASRHSATAPAEQRLSAQTAFDQLQKKAVSNKLKKQYGELGRVEDLKLDYRYQSASGDQVQELTVGRGTPKKSVRKERSILPEPVAPALNSQEREAGAVKPPAALIRTFESEIDSFEISLLDSGYFVLFRKVWRDGQRYIQGALIERQLLLEEIIHRAFQETALSHMSDLVVAYRGEVLQLFGGQLSRDYLSSAQELRGAVLHQVRLPTPLNDLELIFSIRSLPVGAGVVVISWAGAIMLIVLCGGFYLLYRLATKQFDLVQQQQDFVSAVSHELKTPLTSIRMYGELLREGWASEEKKKSYYEYIHDESERLSRLINNVLQLARMTRNELQVNLENVTVAEVMDVVHSKISSQIRQAGYELNLACERQAQQEVILLDRDYFTQVLINLVDNAIKFSAKAETRRIDIGCTLGRDGKLSFTVRDYGPGISREQMKKIFKLFYRPGNELTRETVGTGIGLALVQQLVLAMNGQVDVVNKSPGAEFRVQFLTSPQGRADA